jgi:predicted nucleotidyltransferase
LSLFGSYARNEATKNSDLDLLYELDWTFTTTLGSLQYLEDLLVKEFNVKKVDFVSKRKINPHLKSYIEKDLITIF